MAFDPSKYVQARIVQRRDHTAELWSIRVEHDGDFGFRPGQYATLAVVHGDRALERPYSIVSAPEEASIEFLLELVPDGVLTPTMHGLQVGATMLMRPRPKGRFFLDLDSQRTHHLFLCTVTGIAPFASMVRSLARRPAALPLADGFRILCVHGGSRSAELGYDAELAALDEQFGWFTYVPTISRPWAQPEWDGEVGRVEDLARKYADAFGMRPDNGIVYLCGHPGMIAAGQAIFHRAGFAKADVRQEEYWPLGKEPIKLDERVQAAAVEV